MTLSAPAIAFHDAWSSVKDPLERALEACGGLGGISELESPAEGVADSPSKHLIRNASGEPVAVMLRSQPVAPGLIARSVVKASLAREALGDDLGRVIVPPMISGESNGVSFAVYPWRMPLSNSRWLWPLQRALLRTPGVPRIGGHVDIGAGAGIFGGVSIGNHAKIGANAVVLCDVPAGATAVGVPARVVNKTESCKDAECCATQAL